MQKGYEIIRGALAADAMALYCRATLMQRASYWLPEPAYGSDGRYADAHGEAILETLRPTVERVTGRSLYPCYSFLRIYRGGSELRRHTDRPSCEFSVTLHVGGDEGADWPIWIEDDGQPAAVELEPGDLMVYKGAALPHWRERFTGRWWVQLFLHYVDAAGPYAHFRYDGRPQLGPFNIRKEQRKLPDPSRLLPGDPCWCGSGEPLKTCHRTGMTAAS